MTKPLRAAVIGLGRPGRRHARVLRSLDGVALVAVADTDPVRRAAFEGVHAVADVEDLLNLKLDYCVVATPTGERERVGLALAEAGVHSLIETPPAPSLSAAIRLAEAFDAADVIGAVCLMDRQNPALRELAQRLRGGDFGKIYQVATRRHDPFPARMPDAHVVSDTVIHDVDLAMWLTQRDITSVACSAACVREGEREDLAVAVLRLSGGEIADIQVSSISPCKERIVTVHTARGCVTANALTSRITHYAYDETDSLASITGPGSFTSAGKVMGYKVPGADPLRGQHEAFRNALLDLSDDVATLRQGAAAVAATEAILKAARTGSCVTPSDHVLSR